MVRDFRVLVIDDDDEVLKELPGKVNTEESEFEGRIWRINLQTVHVKIGNPPTGGALISTETLAELAEKCHEMPHVIFADYGYAKKEEMAELRALYNEKGKIAEQDVAGKIFTLKDLGNAARSYSENACFDTKRRDNLKKNFLGFKYKLGLYSYRSKELIDVLQGMKERKNHTLEVLPSCKIVPIDTKIIFYADGKFDTGASSKHDGKFYAHLLTGLIENLIKIEFLNHILKDAKRLKYLRVKRSGITVGVIAAIGVAVGAVAEWLGGHAIALAKAGQVELSLSVVGLTMVFFLALSVIIALAVENFITRLLPEPEQHE
jgi:hypothetical protein